MHSLNLKETDDPHDGPTIAPDIVPAAWADKVLADIKRDAVSRASDQKPAATSGLAAGAAAPSVDTTFRATAADKIQASADRPSGGSWTSRAVVAFMFALCSALAAAAWQHYGHTAKQMIADWAPPFVLAASPASEKTGLTEQLDSPAVQASAADQAAAQPAAAAQPPDGAAPAAAALAPESAQQLQSMARDLAAMGKQVEQLKASIAELKAGQQAMSPDTAKTPIAATPVARTPAAGVTLQTTQVLGPPSVASWGIRRRVAIAMSPQLSMIPTSQNEAPCPTPRPQLRGRAAPSPRR